MYVYFEDSLWLRDTLFKNAVGSFYLILGLIGISINLITLSILSEEGISLTRPQVLLISIQIFLSIAQISVVFVPVPYMIAVNKNYFVNEILIDFPGFLLISFQIFAFLLMVIISINRNVSSISKKFGNFIFSDYLIAFLAIFSFFYSLYHVGSLAGDIRIRRFSHETLDWDITREEIISLVYLTFYAAFASFLLYVTSLADTVYRQIFIEGKIPIDSAAPCMDMAKISAYFCSDVIFAFLFLLPSIFSGWIYSIFNIFGLSFWPAITLISYESSVQRVLMQRTKSLMKMCGGSMTLRKAPREARIRIL